jgi:hypothetical protein
MRVISAVVSANCEIKPYGTLGLPVFRTLQLYCPNGALKVGMEEKKFLTENDNRHIIIHATSLHFFCVPEMYSRSLVSFETRHIYR